MAAASTIAAGAIVGGAAINAYSSSKASSAQAGAAKDAANAQTDASNQMRSDLSPYTALGQQAINPLWSAMGYQQTSDPAAVSAAQTALSQYQALAASHPEWDKGQIQAQIDTLQKAVTDAQSGASSQMTANPNSILQQQFSFNPSDLQNTPGYQFTLQQGLRGVQNQMASQGLGLSGAQIKGALSYGTGLADQTYNQQYNNALSTYNTNYQSASNNVNRLQSLVNTGQNSAAQTGQAAITGAAGAGNYLTQAANATASGTIGTSNAITNAGQNYMTYNALYGNQSSNSNSNSLDDYGYV